jgi:hypothetical protein
VISKEVSSDTAWVLRAIAVYVVLYGIAHLISAVAPLIEALK